MQLPRFLFASLTVAVLSAAAGCNMEKLTADVTSKSILAGSIALDRESDTQFAREAFPASLKTLETFLVSTPENENFLLLLARGYNSYAFGFLEGDIDRAKVAGRDEEAMAIERRAKIFYLRGSEYGFRLLDMPALQKAAQASDLNTLAAELQKVTKKEQARGLFWAAYGWGSAINLGKDDSELLAGLPAVQAMMKRAYELDRDYNDGSPILFFAVYHASLSKALGGKPEEAKRYFDEAMTRQGDRNLLVPFLYARFYAWQVQDRKLFDQLIAKVISVDVTTYPPEMRLTNEIARDRARFWRKHVEDLIPQ
jgi:hypothetical protein